MDKRTFNIQATVSPRNANSVIKFSIDMSAPLEVVVNQKYSYSKKNLPYVVNSAMSAIPEEVEEAKIYINSRLVLEAITQTAPNGEENVVVKLFHDTNGNLEDEYVFVNNECVFHEGRDIPDGLSTGKVIKDFIHNTFFGE